MTRDRDAQRTFESIGARYEQWEDSHPQRPTTHRGLFDIELDQESPMSRMVMAGIGVVVGLILLGLAIASIVTAFAWDAAGRDGAQVGYTIVAFFLTLAGAGCIAATLNHNFRVLDPNRAPAAHH